MIYRVKILLLFITVTGLVAQAQDSTIFIQQKFYRDGEFISSDTLLETKPLSNLTLKWDRKGRLIAMCVSSKNDYGWSEQADYYTSKGEMKLDYRTTVFNLGNSSVIRRTEQFLGSIYDVREVSKIQIDSLNLYWELIYKENKIQELYGYKIVDNDTLYTLFCLRQDCYLDSTIIINSNYSEIKKYRLVLDKELTFPKCINCGILDIKKFKLSEEVTITVSEGRKEVKFYSRIGGDKFLNKEIIYSPSCRIQKRYFIKANDFKK